MQPWVAVLGAHQLSGHYGDHALSCSPPHPPPQINLLPHTGPVRVAVLGASLITYLGIMKVNLSGPGLTSTVKKLWKAPEKSAA